jgi:hypothetical protein
MTLSWKLRIEKDVTSRGCENCQKKRNDRLPHRRQKKVSDDVICDAFHALEKAFNAKTGGKKMSESKKKRIQNEINTKQSWWQ